jgi:outer membrane immunogenic protein
MTRKLRVLAALAGTLLSGPAIAGTVSPAYDWSGFYIGAHAALANTDVGNANLVWGDGNLIGPLTADGLAITRNSRVSFDSMQLGGGIQAGYNYQIGNVVAGLEADFTMFGGRGSDGVSAPFISSPTRRYILQYGVNVDWLATIRGRLGYAADRFFIYGTGGIAFADVELDWSYSTTFNPPQYSSGSGGSSKIATKPIFGGGFEYALNGNSTFKVEYLYMRSIDIGMSGVVSTSDGFSNQITTNANINAHHFLKVGLNWKFGEPGAGKY